jgi:hypothetical protein
VKCEICVCEIVMKIATDYFLVLYLENGDEAVVIQGATTGSGGCNYYY